MHSGEKNRPGPVSIGVISDRYVVERVLGRGGMATVYLCSDLRDKRRVAVKVLRPELSSAVVNERFLREIDFASGLDHPRIPKVLDSGVLDGLPFYVMTYVEGESLRDRLDREKQLPIAEAVRIATAIIGPTTYAHRHGIVHRDLKPENIILDGGDVYILDFGIARAIVESGGDRITSTGIAVGTPAYMSPEQAMCEAVDSRSDVYSLGCVTYEMIAGMPPFVGATAQVVMSRRFIAPPPPLREAREGVPPYIERAIAGALAKAPVDRWASAEEFGRALTQASERVWNANSLAMFGRRLRQRKRLVAAALAVPLAAGFLFAGFALSTRFADGSRARPVADPRRVAVLYFDDHSADQSLAYLASGLTEGLIHELSSVPAIRVVSRNGVKPFREKAVGLDSIAIALSVGTLVEGSVQRSGNRLRVTAYVVDAATSTRLDSKTIEREMGDLFLLEDDLAQQVAALLRRRIGREIRLRETVAGTRNAQARELVFRANEALDGAESTSSNDSLDRIKGFRLLRQADSLFARAENADRAWLVPVVGRGWVARDVALRQEAERSASAFRQAMAHADRALARNPDFAPALELWGNAGFAMASRVPLGDSAFDAIMRRAEMNLKRAVALDPSLASAWGALSRVHVARGELQAGERAAQTAFAMDAYLKDAPRILGSLYLATLMSDSLESSSRWCNRGSRDFPLDPRFIDCRLTLLAEDFRKPPDSRLAWQLVREGARIEPPEKATAVGRPYLPIYRLMLAAVVSARTGAKDSARAVAARARATVGNSGPLVTDLKYDEAFLQLVLGDEARALKLLADYLRERPSLTKLVSQHPRWKPLRANPAFIELVREAAKR